MQKKTKTVEINFVKFEQLKKKRRDGRERSVCAAGDECRKREKGREYDSLMSEDSSEGNRLTRDEGDKKGHGMSLSFSTKRGGTYLATGRDHRTFVRKQGVKEE